MTNLNIAITAPALARPARLRADRIRRDTLVMLAQALREDHNNSVRNALDALIDAAGNPRDTEGAELDALVADIEDLADMGRADMRLSDADVRQLAEQAGDAVAAMAPVLRPVASRQEAGAA